jgi:GcrA cell cycle regulator
LTEATGAVDVRESPAVGMVHLIAPSGAVEDPGEHKMLWTEESIEVLKKLALEGRSANVIAQALGAASRNAVIGKANRIGVRLNGDGRSAAPGSGPQRARRLPPSPFGDDARTRRPGRRNEVWAFADAEVGAMRWVRFEDIRQTACRWPLGDPRCGDFAYCGLAPAEGHSYCPGHCRLAYRPG